MLAVREDNGIDLPGERQERLQLASCTACQNCLLLDGLNFSNLFRMQQGAWFRLGGRHDSVPVRKCNTLRV